MTRNWAAQAEPDQQAPTGHAEYRVKVVIARDLPNGLRAGDEFTPTDPRSEVGSLEYTVQWWLEQGHDAVLQRRQATTTYSQWEESHGN